MIVPMPFLTPEEALRLAARYFEAATTEAEEAALRRFVAVGPGRADARFDTVRAVMGFAAYGARRQATPLAVRPRRAMARRVAAAVVALLAGAATLAVTTYRTNNRCVAYVHGQRVTDAAEVMGAMQASVRHVAAPTGEPSVERQLQDLVRTLD